MEKRKFYDVHCHVMNLSHPNFIAFLRRFEPTLKEEKLKIFLGVNLIFLFYLLFSTISPRIFAWVLKKSGMSDIFNRVKNLLVIMEHDADNVFQLLDQEAERQLLDGGKLNIGCFNYEKIVLTPLMMDFGYKNMTNPHLYYNSIPVQKPIVEQVLDLFNGIKSYYHRSREEERFFEIYPFLGINTTNYEFIKIEKMLDKYFGSYRGKPADLAANLGKFTGDIEEMGSNFFSGIKVYPPLGFDPWPGEKEERKKVELVYEYCSKKRIPITTHCSNGGYRIIDTQAADDFTSPERWGMVLKRYPQLKLNFGHLGNQGKRKKKWENQILNLMVKYENVYGDFSCRGFNHKYYQSLKETLDQGDFGFRKMLRERILFGSDFTINLLWTDSYSSYLKIFVILLI
ncbi:MAG: amidohydrolase family protein [Bacillota bacterium]